MGDVGMCLGIYNIHIGVGSGVVRSNISGNARALSSGTDNKEVPTLFSFCQSHFKETFCRPGTSALWHTMKQAERASIIRIVSDIIKSDAIIDMRELNALVAVKERYAIKKEDEALSASYTLADAISTLATTNEGLRNDLLGDFVRVVMADDYCAREEALITLALQCCLSDKFGCAGKVISINSQETSKTDSKILYVESEYSQAINDHIHTYFREITSEARLAGFDFVYLPQIVSHYKSVPEDELSFMASFLYPRTSEERCKKMARWLENITTAEFCKNLFISKLNIHELIDVAPSLMIKIGCSFVNDKFYTNYLLIEIEKDVLKLVREILDTFSSYYRTTSLNYVKESKERFVFTGFYKQLFDMYMLRKGIKSTVVIDIYRSEIRFPEADAVLSKLHRREKALYALFLLESSSGGINFNKPNTAKQLERYNKRMETLQVKYGLIYKKFGGDADKTPNLGVPEVRLPMISLIKRRIGELQDVLAHSEDYTIQRNIYGNYSVSIPSSLCYCRGVSCNEVKPLFEVDDWVRISAL